MKPLVILLLLAVSAEIPKPAYDCATVQAFVEQHGRIAALALAIRNGATLAQLREARKCLSKPKGRM